jgi:IMP dehydrogenase
MSIAYRENENEIIADIVGGLRSGLTYGGAANIRELQRKLDYIQISWASKIEGLAHGALDLNGRQSGQADR